MLLGKAPNPQSGEITRDLDGARMFIDQLEMLEVKTKGNLNREEEQLLKQSLMSLRMAFVEAIESATKETSKIEPAPESKPAAEPAAPAPDKPPGDDESKKKFTKKY